MADQYLTDRKRARGLGSSREGTHHHWQMMVSSSALVVLVPLFVLVFGLAFGGSHADVVAYLSHPFVAIALGISLTVGIVHLLREAQAAIEDYMHGPAQKLTLMAAAAFSYTLIAVGLFALARIAI